MSEPINWHASLAEHRTAWTFFFSCLLLIAIAVVKPDIFDLSSYSTPPARQQTVVEKAVSPPLPQVEEETEAEPVIEAETVTAPVKPAVIDAAAKVNTKAVVAKKATPVAPAENPEPASSAPTAGYYVQLGAFSDKPRAQGLVDQLGRSGLHAIINQKSSALFAVWAGPESERKSVETLQRAIESKMKIKGFIIHHTGS
ncbi:MAG: hypothetical protein AUJ57_09065 [Zetaproteobacteria bacterium CG1_02_53_45]|nr:MAG: hypothetical protein AUJ57_09065 [Zetaproteobacteria bacterium CG1_02_53_45]